MSVVLQNKSPLMKALSKLHNAIQKGNSEGTIARLSGSFTRKWKELGIDSFLAENGVTDYSYKNLVSEWSQNAIEHGSNFSSDVSIEMIIGEDGVAAFIEDKGDGIDPEFVLQKQRVGSGLYEREGYEAGRGYGLHGALNNSEIELGFEKLSDGFRTTLYQSLKKNKQ